MAIRLGARSKFQQPFDPITAILFKMIQALTFFFVLAVLFMNPAAKKGIIDPKAEYIITTHWADGNPDDADLWVEDPSGNIIWFRNREAGLVHLDRDDRGMLNDTIETAGEVVVNPLNQEVVTIRGVVPGEYVVNVHYYATETGEPLEVSVRVDKVNPALKVVYYDKLTLEKKGDEKTALRFTLDTDGEVVDINHVFKSIVVTR
jgi:hypothetical protein